MPRAEMIQIDELEGMPTIDLHEQVEKVQEDNIRLEGLPEEACEYLDAMLHVEDVEDAQEIMFNIKKFLERQLENEVI